jgi:two-component system response regulator HydG
VLPPDTLRTAPTLPATIPPSAEKHLGLHWFLPDGTYRFIALQEASIAVGRDGSADVPLPFSDVSRRHLEVRKSGPIFVARDPGSRNGVHHNGELLTGERPLSRGDLLRLGECLGVVGAAYPAPPETTGNGILLGPTMQEALGALKPAARSDLPVVLQGETGTGKEAVARFIHEASGRTGAFLGLNCAALPESLAESELFGHERGAFTGAHRSRIGHFREAQGGTLLLDEIADLSLGLQAKLLRVLEEREVVSVGDSVPVPIDVRVIAATQEPLEGAVARRRFRGDLLARINGLTVVLPPLRDRREEIPFLFRAFLRRHAPGRPFDVSVRLLEQLCLHEWPFNVRELALAAKRMVTIHGNERRLTRAHFVASSASATPGSPAPAEAASPHRTPGDEREALIGAMRACAGNLSKAAEQVGLSRGRAYRLLQDMDLRSLREEP